MASVIVGAVFGLASMYKASASYVLPADRGVFPVFKRLSCGQLFAERRDAGCSLAL